MVQVVCEAPLPFALSKYKHWQTQDCLSLLAVEFSFSPAWQLEWWSGFWPRHIWFRAIRPDCNILARLDRGLWSNSYVCWLTEAIRQSAKLCLLSTARAGSRSCFTQINRYLWTCRFKHHCHVKSCTKSEFYVAGTALTLCSTDTSREGRFIVWITQMTMNIRHIQKHPQDSVILLNVGCEFFSLEQEKEPQLSS